MIQREFYTQCKDGVKLYRAYSDAGMMIRQNETGVEYAEAIDVEGASYTYTEAGGIAVTAEQNGRAN